jgi:hypothetical protein
MVQSASYSLWIGTATFHHVATFAIVKAAPESRLSAVAHFQTLGGLGGEFLPAPFQPFVIDFRGWAIHRDRPLVDGLQCKSLAIRCECREFDGQIGQSTESPSPNNKPLFYKEFRENILRFGSLAMPLAVVRNLVAISVVAADRRSQHSRHIYDVEVSHSVEMPQHGTRRNVCSPPTPAVPLTPNSGRSGADRFE